MIGDFFDLNEYRYEQLKSQNVDLDRAYRVLSELQSKIGGTELYRLLTSHYIASGIIAKALDDAVRTIELLILPHALELAEGDAQHVHRALNGLLKRSELWHGYKDSFFDGWMKLSSEPSMIRAASNELRVIAALERAELSPAARGEVLSGSNSPPTRILSMNTPLDLLLQARPECADRIIEIIIHERETDGDRIAEILDSDAPAIASGIL